MTTERTIPKATDRERQYLGALLRFPERANDILGCGITARDFIDKAHAAIFAAAERQQRAGAIDPARLVVELKDCREFADQSAATYLLDLAECIATSAYVESDAEAIVNERRKRQLVDIAETGKLAAMNGHGAADVLGTMRADLWELEQEIEAITPRDQFTFGDLRRAYPTLLEPVLEGCFRLKDVINIISTSKSGKSWFVHLLLLCIITGRYFLDRFKTTPGKVLLIDNELTKPEIVRRIGAVADAMGIPQEHYESDLIVWPLRGDLKSLSQLVPRFRGIEPGEFPLIICDAKYRLEEAGASENDNLHQAQFYNLGHQITEITGSAIAFVHHGSKGSQSEKSVVDVGSGAGAQARAADCHLILREHEEPDHAVLEAAVRSFAPIEPMTLKWVFPLWTPADDVDPSRLKRRQTANEVRQQASDSEAAGKIINAIREHGGATARKLRERTGLGPDRQQRVLDKMAADGDLRVEPIVIRGNETREYHLANPQD